LLLPTPVTINTIYVPKYSAECAVAVTVIDGSLENKALLLPLSFTASFTLVFKQEKKRVLEVPKLVNCNLYPLMAAPTETTPHATASYMSLLRVLFLLVVQRNCQ
jgi:hypothetical protein